MVNTARAMILFAVLARGAPPVIAQKSADEAFQSTVQAGPGGTSVTLRMFVDRQGRWVAAGATGSDMDGYDFVTVTELRSPLPQERWFLLSGQLTGANGPNTRMRIYAHDGRRFRTVWMPENVWGTFTFAARDRGFTVKGTYYRSGAARDEEYALANDGVYRLVR
jgi:hypothetical protein